MTYQDIHSIQAFHEQIVIAVKAPEETRLDVPAPREVGSAALQEGFEEGPWASCQVWDHCSRLSPVFLSS